VKNQAHFSELIILELHLGEMLKHSKKIKKMLEQFSLMAKHWVFELTKLPRKATSAQINSAFHPPPSSQVNTTYPSQTISSSCFSIESVLISGC
jgi:hypothetical protein